MNDFFQNWAGVLGTSPELLALLLKTLLIVLVYILARLLLGRLVIARIDDVSRRYTLRKTVSYTLNILLAAAVAGLWLEGVDDILTYLGILSAGLAIALQDPITNLAGWLFLVVRKPFKVGDRIQIAKDHTGDVIDQRLFSFSLIEVGNWVAADQSTGRIIHIPNNVVFRQAVANYTQGFDYIWHEIPVTVTFESDWRKAKAILEHIAKEKCEEFNEEAARQIHEAANKYLIIFRHLTPIVWVSVVDIGVTLTLRFVCRVRQRRSTEHEIWQAILDAFAKEAAVDCAYPTQRIYYNRTEGKPGAGGPPPGNAPSASVTPV